MEKMGVESTPKRLTPVQTKLSDVYRQTRKTPDVEKVKRERQVCRAVGFGVVKQEPVDCFDNVVNCSGLEVKKELEMGVQSRYGSFPELQTGVNSFAIRKLVKLELLSPSSCVTNDSVFGEGETEAAAHVKGCHAMSADADLVAPVTLSPVKSLAAVQDDEQTEELPDISSDCSTLEVLVTAAVQVQKVLKAEAAIEFGEKLATAPESCGEEVVCGEQPSAPHVLKVVKAEAGVEFGEKLAPAQESCGDEVVCGEEPSAPHVHCRELEACDELDMSLTEMQNVEHPLGSEARGEEPSAAHVQSRTIEACDALDVSPAELQKVEHPLGCEVRVEGSSTAHVQSREFEACDALDIPTIEVQKVAHPLECEETSHASVKRVVVHVKSEPVETQADFSLKEPERVSLPTGVKEELLTGVLSQPVETQADFPLKEPEGVYVRTGVKEKLLTSTPTGVLSQPQTSSENEHSSSDSEESEAEEEAVEPQESQKEAKNRNMNPGRRIQGGRIYDSSLGRTCHWCRQKTVEHHVNCRECTIHYCGPCLMNRNGENVMEELAEGVRWLCPKCRNGCGPGCENCCNCGPCRKAGGKTPTGQLIGKARSAGFLNVHDYLVHLETGEGPDEIAERKEGRDWTNCGRFEWKESSQAHGEPSSDDSSDEFTLNEVTSTQLHQGKIGMKFVKKFVQSQLKRKRGQMRGAMPPKRTQMGASPSERYRDVHSIIARLKVPAVRREGSEVGAATTRNNSVVQENTAPKSQSGGMMRVKREFSDVAGSDVEVAKRRKIEGQRHVSSAADPFSRVKCEPETTSLSDDNPSVVNYNEAGPRRKFNGGSTDRASSVSESELTYNMRHGGASSADEQRGSIVQECPSDPQGSEYRTKLKFALAQPFDAKELEILEESVRCRKPVQKLRQMRGRIVDVVTEDEGFSYLDHHQDFALKLEEAQSPPLKLALLRGFFFWLQHTCMEGAFKPWPASPTEFRPQSEDCMETEGPDCQVTAVVLQLDEGKDAPEPESNFEIHDHDMLQGPTESITVEMMTCNPLGSQALTQSLIPFKARKNPVEFMQLPKMKGQIVTVQPFQVVLCLPAPALCKNR